MTPEQPSLESGEARVREIARLMDDLKAEDIVALDLRGVANFTDFFVICTARSRPQARAIARRVYETLKARGIRPHAPIEDESPRWTIVDYGGVLAHVFDPEARAQYSLETIWGDGVAFDWRAGMEAGAAAAGKTPAVESEPSAAG